MFLDVSDMLINVFGFQPKTNKDTVIRVTQDTKKVQTGRLSRVSTVYEELYKQDIGKALRDQQAQARQKMTEINNSENFQVMK